MQGSEGSHVRRPERDEQGFTLIELLIVIVVLGLLAAIVVFAVQNLNPDSAQVACKSVARTVEIAAEYFKGQTGAYPTTVAALVPVYVRSSPSTAHYTIALGSSAASIEPTVPASGPSGPPGNWPAGRVLVAPGPPPVGAGSYRDFNAAVNPPCSDPVVK